METSEILVEETPTVDETVLPESMLESMPESSPESSSPLSSGSSEVPHESSPEVQARKHMETLHHEEPEDIKPDIDMEEPEDEKPDLESLEKPAEAAERGEKKYIRIR